MKSTTDLLIEMLDFVGREVADDSGAVEFAENLQFRAKDGDLTEDEVTMICDWTAVLVEKTKADPEWYAVIADVLAFPLGEAA